ncbi:uncharacterized protein OCT59_015036 [Rhizophagus irregularis]|uniref:RING-type domain-containing protein n=2 Tax=Rhizophagus irregularis TaxID=588596 RepID=U9SWS3_RHIID|nr:hypothetical protein GLOIN_2v1723747 [Rhizophagus irregularis DAOM 181602=DAOM 197198]EXX72754.1 ubiquitin-protein ligase SAN1 [Rhizophagus irregularis DAOM 197198w]UZO22680.1 hypothetical protein OCT59_015036 [Rhizophagus irregularis]POG59244.1 hypothetical protein GLOIN_2v1723747 [Rhizophagus irregularis DAOM 181602=DAOM 197198]CAB5210916.1 unnamed protein product [Rhizophagus irregularis]GBC51272.2 E3 ubiquitin-protein ligase RNF115 isoform X2 [Rhizophagus irregularis DAOM 181602=DAOM 19|eukprot:XP_025166110.1 hypothetical protein GLOIN_2v1723747 [Rhizophagus irregularis DAOM 181602=DAOM 197198]
MEGQQNNQTGQNTNVNQSQQSRTQNQTPPPPNQNSGGFPGLFFPINIIFRERARSSGENNSQDNGSQGGQGGQQGQEGQEGQQEQEQIPQVQFFVYPIPGGDGQASPGVFFFTPFFFPQQQVHKPRASESALKKLPIITITKEYVDSQASCPICLEHFSLPEENKEKVTVRQMPCNHIFCESCLFQWLRQNNSCPLCRKEIEEEAEQKNDNDSTTTASPTPPETTNVAQPNSHSHDSQPTCNLASVGCCEETENNAQTPVITLPQCHHRFHASCLRTSLLVEGYSPGDFNSIPHPLNFHCPTCRSPAIVQSSMLKMPTAPHDEQQEQQVAPFNLPITIHIPESESDDMDLDLD